jgi:hypothetical protein
MYDRKHAAATAGESITAKAMTYLRKTYPHMADVFSSATVIQPGSAAKNGQWACADCGRMFLNNSAAFGHTRSHRLVWWTGYRFEEA